MKKKRVGKIIAIILLVILIGFCGFLSYSYFIGFTPEDRLEKKLTKMTESLYEDYYYDLLVEDKGSNADAIEYLKQYSDKGLKISFDSLKSYYDTIGGMNYTDFKDCDEDKTMVYIHPKAPYGKKDYTLEVKLSCKLK